MTRPPPVLRWLARLAPRDRRGEVRDALAEGYRRRAARSGEGAARAWLWREAAGLVRWRLGGATGPGRGVRGRQGPHGMRGGGIMGMDLMQDLRFGARTLRRRPGFTLAAVTVLALGIGAPTTVFTLVDRIFLWTPPQVEAPHRLLRVYRSWAPGQGGGALSHPDFEYYRQAGGALAGLAAWSGGGPVAWATEGTSSDQVHLGFVSHDYFDVLGVPAAAGRYFTADENARPGENPVVVLSYGLWQRAFGGDPSVVGRTVRVNGAPFTVVGVVARGFRGLSPIDEVPEAWAPLAMFGAVTRASGLTWWQRDPDSRENWLQVVGRLAPGATFEAATAELDALSAALDYPGRADGEGVLVARQVLYNPNTARSLASLSKMLLLAVSVVLLVAASNVAVLLLARGSTRLREVGIRNALGASGGRVGRQFLVETALLTGVGGALGIALAWVLADVAGSLLPYAFAGPFRPDARVLAGALALTAVTALSVGLAPALAAARHDPAAAMGDGRTAPGRSRIRDGLVVLQVALSMVLVAGAVLFARSFQAARSQDLGFTTDRRLIVQVDLQARGLQPDEGRAFIGEALDRIEALPGVEAVATTRQIPFQGDWSTELRPDLEQFPDGPREPLFVGLNAVSPGYFDLMGIPLVRGRPFQDGDGPGGVLAVVVNQTLAEALWPGQEAVGKVVEPGDGSRYQVVGVARNAQYYELGEDPVAQLYLAVQQRYQARVHFVVATRGDPTAVAPAVQQALKEQDRDLAVGWISSMDAVFDEVTARYRVSATLVGLFGVLALVLAASGLYGVMAFVVARRTREIGVRIALGAPRGRVAGGVLRRGLALTGVGIAMGLAGALAVRRFAASLVFGVEPTDPSALLGAAAILLGVAALAALVPARRATRVDPLDAMRVE